MYNIQLVDVNVNREIEQSSVMPHLSLSEEDIDKIATAVKQKITVDIESIIIAKIEPLIQRSPPDPLTFSTLKSSFNKKLFQ
jgi:hypothetical protein